MPRPMPLYRRARAYSEDFPIEQKDAIPDDELSQRQPDIIRVDKQLNKELLDEIAFNEEPVTIRLDPSTETNAPNAVPIWVQGKGCEVLIRGRWVECPYVPVGQVLTIKRKYLAVLIAAKLDKVTTHYGKPGDENPINEVKRFTSSYQAFQVLEDKNPKGMQWLSEMRRRNF